jgi:hypothetical protein
MDTRSEYQQLIEVILLRHADSELSQDSVVTEAILDHPRSRYILMNVGWQGEHRVHAPVVHVDIRGDKFWIQKDGTEYGIGNELLDAGVPPEHIVPAFYHESHRTNMAFATN